MDIHFAYTVTYKDCLHKKLKLYANINMIRCIITLITIIKVSEIFVYFAVFTTSCNVPFICIGFGKTFSP